jgi:phosphoenolpyruvate phosphomutase
MSLKHRVLPDVRRACLRALLQSSRGVRIIEAHNGLSALVASTSYLPSENGNRLEFDGLWISSLTSSASKGLPDIELGSLERRLETIEEIVHVTHKPVIVDGDTGGEAVNFEYFCSKLEQIGVSAVVIEDKQYPKRNSLCWKASHTLEDPKVFAAKIQRGRSVLLSNDFMIFARLESLIVNQGVEDALARARIYLLAGVDGIMIHSKERTIDQVHAFLNGYKYLCAELGFRKPIICVPTTYNVVTDEDLFRWGADIVIHANHLLRAAHHAMQQVCETILKNNRSLEADELCTPVSHLFELVGFADVVARDQSPAEILSDVFNADLTTADCTPCQPSVKAAV